MSQITASTTASSTSTMAQIALPRHQATQSQSGIGSPLYQRRHQPNAGPIELIPNPEFSFPMRDPAPSDAGFNSRPMSLQVYPTGRRGSMPHMRQKSISALPAFSFNPSGTPVQRDASPQRSPTHPNTPSKPIHGHRRGGSELIGGDARPGGSTLMSNSPTKTEGFLSTPNGTLRPGPPPGRRGHQHRRSGAVSSHDLTSIMNPPVSAHTGSEPNTPSEGNQFALGHSFNRSISQPSLRDSRADDEANARPPSRARVGFSDKVEYIRPLSTISSETETSLSTIRGHSAANSLSSIVSGNSQHIARGGRTTLSTVEDEGRPSTAGAVLDQFMSNSLNEKHVEMKRPMSAISPISPSAPTMKSHTKRRPFFRLESRQCENAIRTLPTSISDPALSKSFESPVTSPKNEDTAANDNGKPKSSSRKLRPRKVKSWANSIITGKAKSKRNKKAKNRPATPPPGSASDAEDTDSTEDLEFEPNFDEDTTVTIVSPTESSIPEPKLDTSFSSWQPRPLTRVDSDIMSPIIDLDAALGPFNTPGNGSSPRNQQRGFSAHRRLQSASALTPIHRRTESAPELVPFQRGSSAVSNISPMADVFEEDEPEEDDDEPQPKDAQAAPNPEKCTDLKVSVVESESEQEDSTISWDFKDGLGIERNSQQEESAIPEITPPAATSQTTSGHASGTESLSQLPEPDVVEVVEDYEEPRTSSLTHSSESTVTPQMSAVEMKENVPTMNLSLPLPQQSLMTPDTITSSFSSPDYRSSQASFDTPRLGTAASSITDYPVMPSPRFGEPGPELRISVDDVPSLTSSRSTMTSAMQSAFPLSSPRRLGDRTASLSSDPSEAESRRRKRSSIASLSRLINSSSYNERSKLSIEQRPQSEHLEPAKDKKKTNRLSKLKFWKSSKDQSSRTQTPV